MICPPFFVHELIQRIRNNDDTVAKTLCRCFEPEIQAEARFIDYWNRKTVEQELCNEFVFRIQNAD